VKQFLWADAGGAEFADDHASRGIREHGGIGERRACSDGEGQDTENSVASSRHVENLAARRAAFYASVANTSVGHFKTRCRNAQVARRGFFKTRSFPFHRE